MKNTKLESEFRSPGSAWRGKPFWSWNGELRPAELRRQVHVMKEMGLGGYFMHSRSGLITEYLGDGWFDCINATADEGNKIGMENWLYDEDRWPSGSAGGKVTVEEKYRAKSLRIHQMRPERYQPSEEDFLVFYADLDGLTMHSYRRWEKDASLPAPRGTWYVLRFTIKPDDPETVFNGTTYIDTMDKEAVERFIELTHEQYKKRMGDRWNSIHGIFTDEPHRGHGMDNRKEEDGVIICDIGYTPDLFDRFLDAYGYDAREVLPELFYQPQGRRVAQVKLHYFDLACNLFDERFGKTIQDWCHANGIAFTGHVLNEDTLDHQTVSNGSLMRFYQYMDVPGVDVLTEGAFTPWNIKQLASVGRQLRRPMLLSELYGCTGWQMNLRSHKMVGDWQALLGINLRCQHLSWYTMEGESKRDYPASILHQSAWYHDYDCVESYFARFGRMMSEGEPMCDLLVLNPIESVWCQTYLGWATWLNSTEPEVHKLNGIYHTTSRMLLGNHIDYDYGEEQMIRDATVETDESGRAVLCVGAMRYHTVLVSGMLTIRPSTLALLSRFLEMGGKVIFAGEVPNYVDAVPSDLPAKLATHAITVPFEEKAVVDAICDADCLRAELKTADGENAALVMLQMRKTEHELIVALLNTDRDHPTGELKLTVSVDDGWHCERWRLEDGAILNADAQLYYSGGKATISFSMEAAGTAVYRFSSDHAADMITEAKKTTVEEKQITGTYEYELAEPNVCVLDYARVRIDDDAWSDENEVLRLDDAVRRHYGVEIRNGEMIQPWYSKIYENEVLGKVEVAYRFTVDVMPEGKVFLAGERPFENEYAINGVHLTPLGIDDFWVDDAFKRMEIPRGALKLGENTIIIAYEFRKTSNIEAVYLLGNFGVALEKAHCRIVSLPEKLDIAVDLRDQGLPFYGAQVTYRIPAEVVKPLASDGCEVQAVFGKNYNGLIKVKCGVGDPIRVAWEPYTADITEGIAAGADLEITAVLTRRNTFGPLHQRPAIVGAYGPFSYRSSGAGWSDEYMLIESKIPYIGIRSLKHE